MWIVVPYMAVIGAATSGLLQLIPEQPPKKEESK